jgi:hypothetical protein
MLVSPARLSNAARYVLPIPDGKTPSALTLVRLCSNAVNACN